jgi:hypothetical protein
MIDREKLRLRRQRYNWSEKGRARHRRYNYSLKGAARRQRYECSERGLTIRGERAWAKIMENRFKSYCGNNSLYGLRAFNRLTGSNYGEE